MSYPVCLSPRHFLSQDTTKTFVFIFFVVSCLSVTSTFSITRYDKKNYFYFLLLCPVRRVCQLIISCSCSGTKFFFIVSCLSQGQIIRDVYLVHSYRVICCFKFISTRYPLYAVGANSRFNQIEPAEYYSPIRILAIIPDRARSGNSIPFLESL